MRYERIILNNEDYNRIVEEKGIKADKEMNDHPLNYFIMCHTMTVIEDDKELQSSIRNSINSLSIYYSSDKLNFDFDLSGTTNCLMTSKRTFEAAKEYSSKKVAILDFASSRHPGGNPKRARAQEECLYRVSTLYLCLESQYSAFYEKHKNAGWKGTDDIMYVPDVKVFKTDEHAPKMMEIGDRYDADVIVCAAPHIFDNVVITDYEIEEMLRRRIERILQVAQINGVEVLILGAFGNGAFSNPPVITAKVFKSLLKKYHFDTVEFAIPQIKGKKNYEIYRSVLFDK